jgi:myo-inositol-1(or 4)-monophosphatase
VEELDDDALMDVLDRCAAAVGRALEGVAVWGPAGTVEGQHHSDLVADRAALPVLAEAGLGVLSEESGLHRPERPLLAVLDPLDGSTNAAQGLPWYATSVCVLDEGGPRAALVVNQALGVRYQAVRGRGSRRDGRPIRPSGAASADRSVVSLAGYPPRSLGWRQYRVLGAAALELCAVAEGTLDAFVDCSPGGLGPWDYLGGALVCTEAGAATAEARGLELVVRGHADRRSPIAAATPELLDELARAWEAPR